MKKAKQKSRRFKRFIRKQLKKAKEDIIKLPMTLADMSPYPYLNGFCHYPGGLSHGVLPNHDGTHWHNPHYDNYAGHHNHVRHHHSTEIHLHNPHVPRHNHCHGSDSIKVFDKEESEIKVKKKM